jgi:adenylosuccinate lyase
MAINADATLDLQRQIADMKNKLGSPIFDTYQTSLTGRYCSKEMSQLFSQRSRHSVWRKLWLYLAESEKELGIDTISDEALKEMRDHLVVTDEDFEIARVEEKKRRHDVMAHVHAFGQVAPKAAGIIHYGVSTFLISSVEQVISRSRATRESAHVLLSDNMLTMSAGNELLCD